MKVLLTGANGFLGSHILDGFRESSFDVSILLRRTSDTSFIAPHMDDVTVHYGSLADADSVADAMKGVEAVVHCAAKTKALSDREYFLVNRDGTSNVVRAAAARSETLRHFVLVSSLAVAGPALPDDPARETSEPRPTTVYAKSKLEGENAVRGLTEVPWTILRPAAVYGPRDRDFLSVFESVGRGLVPLPFGGHQSLSLVYAPDVVEAVRCCLGQGRASGKIYHVAAEPPTTARELVDTIARIMGKRPRKFSVPGPVVYVACVLQGWVSQLRRRPHILNQQKWPELSAPGWVTSTDRIRSELGFTAATSLEDGLAKTAAWYRKHRWL